MMLDVICRIGRQLGRRFSAMQPLHTLRVIQQHPVLQIHDPLRSCGGKPNQRDWEAMLGRKYVPRC